MLKLLKVTALYHDERNKGCLSKDWVVVVAIPNGFQRFRFDNEDEARQFASTITEGNPT